MKDVLLILLSPAAWLASFSAVYGLHGIVCETNLDGSVPGLALPRLLFAAAFILAVLLQLGLLAALHSGRFGATQGFTRIVSRTSGWTGLVATIWTLFPTLATSTCG